MPSNKKQRLEEILIEKVLATDKKSAFVVVTEGKVFVDGAKMVSPAQMVKSDAKIEIRGKMQYVGRGAFKLEGALEKFGIDVSGKNLRGYWFGHRRIYGSAFTALCRKSVCHRHG